MCTFRIWLSWPRLAISAFRFSGNGSRKLANQHSFLRSALPIWVSACLRSSSALQFPPPNSHLKPPGRCPISASRFLIKVARHRKRCENFCPLQGSFGPSGPTVGRGVRKWVPARSFSDSFFQLWARKAQMIPVAGLGNPSASGKNHCGNFRSSAPQPPRNINGQPWNSWRFPREAVFLDDFPLSPPQLGNGRNTVSSALFRRRELTEPHWVLRQTRWVLLQTRWVRVYTQIIGWEELTGVAPRNSVSPEKLTELSVWNRTHRNRIRPVSEMPPSPTSKTQILLLFLSRRLWLGPAKT